DTTNPMGDPKMGDPKMGDPGMGDPKMGDPGMGDPKVGENNLPQVGDPPSESNLVELTNLLPNGPPSRDPEHVAHYFFRDIFGPLRGAAFNKNGFIAAQFRQRLGFSVLDVDDLIRAERFSQPAWTFTVVHTRSPLDLEAMKTALALKAGGPA